MRRKVILLVVTVVVIVGCFVATLLGSSRPVLGLDLQGGTSIVLAPVKGSDLSTLDTAVAIIRNRVDGLGIAEPDVSRQGNNIVVDLPGVKNAAEADQLVGKTAELRFRVVHGIDPVLELGRAGHDDHHDGQGRDDHDGEGRDDHDGEGRDHHDGRADARRPRPGTPSGRHGTIDTVPIAAVRPAAATTTVRPRPRPRATASTTATGATATTVKGDDDHHDRPGRRRRRARTARRSRPTSPTSRSSCPT